MPDRGVRGNSGARANDRRMSIPTETDTPYYRRWINQVARQMWAYVWAQIVIVVAGFAILVLEIIFGGESEASFGPNVRATVYVYGALVFIYFVYQVLRAPFVLDAERAKVITDNKEDFDKARASFKLQMEDAHAALARATQHIGPYSQAQLAQLATLSREGNELLKVHISVNAPDATAAVDKWYKRHNDWRDHILSILSDKDAAIFERPIPAGKQTEGHRDAINGFHGNRRGQLMEELERLATILERY